VLIDDFISYSDIDECEEGTDGCDHSCTNTDGSYYCTCMDGYELESDNHTCSGAQLFINTYVYSMRICAYVCTYAQICTYTIMRILVSILLQYIYVYEYIAITWLNYLLAQILVVTVKEEIIMISNEGRNHYDKQMMSKIKPE